MTDSKRLTQLTQLTEIRLQAEQAKMKEILAREARLRKNLTDLTQRVSDEQRAARRLDTPAKLARADVQWEAWVDQRRKIINVELAQVLAQKDVIRSRLKLAFGKDTAANALQVQAVETAKQTLRRRSDYAS